MKDYSRIFSIATVLLGWYTGMIVGFAIMMGIDDFYWTWIPAIALMIFFFYMMSRDEKEARE